MGGVVVIIEELKGNTTRTINECAIKKITEE